MPEVIHTAFSVAPHGARIAYLDSGPPADKDVYSTLLIVHGFSWNAGVFGKVIENASSHGIRVIAINRRGYKDSTPFGSEDLATFASDSCTSNDRTRFRIGQAHELADFIGQLCDNKMACARHNNQGGITLLGWSLGNAFACDFMFHVPTLAHDLSCILKNHLRSLILFDCPFEVLTLDPPFVAYDSLAKTLMSNGGDSIATSKFMADGISGYFEYPLLSGHLSADILSWPDGDRAARYGPPYNAPLGKSISMVEAESGRTRFQSCYQPDAMPSDIAVQVTHLLHGELLDVTEAVVFGDPDQSLWPDIRVEYAYCTNSLPNCVYAGEASRTRFEAAVPGRKMKAISGANHFLQWAEPNRFLEEIIPLM